MRNRLLALAGAAVLAGILVAGLWPFHAPKNRVHWLAESGLWFGRHGTALSAGVFRPQPTQGDGPCAIEIAFSPGTTWQRHTILAFYGANHSIPFSIRQSNRALVIESAPRTPRDRAYAAKLYVPDIFRGNRFVSITIASDGRETVVYVNGATAAESRDFAFSRHDLAGRLVIANSPLMDDSGTGVMRGLAIDNQFVTSADAARQYQSWANNGRPALIGGAQPEALYLFDQAAGRVVRNQAGQGPDLYIPRQFTVLDQLFLERPWHEYKSHSSYWNDALINIAGFVPLGFFFCAYFSLVRRSRHAALMTILLGAAVSITIEILQAFLPTRFSGMTDLFTNTFGTAVGVALFGRARLVCESLARSRNLAIRDIATWLTT